MWRGLLCLVALMCSGCGLILTGREQTVTIETVPTDALLKVPDVIENELTPTKVTLPRAQSALLQITKPGYQEKWVVLDKEKSTAIILLDILTSGPIGVIVDWQMGTWYKLSPSSIVVTLEEVVGDAGPLSPVEIRLTDATVQSADPDVKFNVIPFDNVEDARQYLEQIGVDESD